MFAIILVFILRESVDHSVNLTSRISMKHQLAYWKQFVM